MNKRIALLYFSRQARVEAQEKTWFKGNATFKNRHLAKSLIEQSRKAIDESGFPVYHFHEGNQEGKTFGQRLANAYQELYDNGFDAVVSVGNDSPEIAQLDWGSIRSKLDSGKNVLGKSIRGGAYLLGINKENFQKDAFQELPWQSNRLFLNLYQQLNSAENQVVELEVLRDLNTFFDLKKFHSAKKTNSSLKKLFAELLIIKAKFYFLILSFISQNLRFAQLRAPPY